MDILQQLTPDERAFILLYYDIKNLREELRRKETRLEELRLTFREETLMKLVQDFVQPKE